MQLAERQARQRGLFPTPLLLDPHVFVQWCDAVNVVPCLDALRAFAILKRGRVGGPLDDFLDGDWGSDDDGRHIIKPIKRGRQFIANAQLQVIWRRVQGRLAA